MLSQDSEQGVSLVLTHIELTKVFRVKIMREIHRPLDGAVEAVCIRVGVTADRETVMTLSVRELFSCLFLKMLRTSQMSYHLMNK